MGSNNGKNTKQGLASVSACTTKEEHVGRFNGRKPKGDNVNTMRATNIESNFDKQNTITMTVADQVHSVKRYREEKVELELYRSLGVNSTQLIREQRERPCTEEGNK